MPIENVGTQQYLASQASVVRFDRPEYLTQHLDAGRTSSQYVNAAGYGLLLSRRNLRSPITRRKKEGTYAISPAKEISDIRIDEKHSEWEVSLFTG